LTRSLYSLTTASTAFKAMSIMKEYGTEVFSMKDVKPLRIHLDVINRRLALVDINWARNA